MTSFLFDKDTTKSLEIINNTPNEFKIMKKKTTKYLHAKNKNNVNMKNRNSCDTSPPNKSIFEVRRHKNRMEKEKTG